MVREPYIAVQWELLRVKPTNSGVDRGEIKSIDPPMKADNEYWIHLALSWHGFVQLPNSLLKIQYLKLVKCKFEKARTYRWILAIDFADGVVHFLADKVYSSIFLYRKKLATPSIYTPNVLLCMKIFILFIFSCEYWHFHCHLNFFNGICEINRCRLYRLAIISTPKDNLESFNMWNQFGHEKMSLSTLISHNLYFSQRKPLSEYFTQFYNKNRRTMQPQTTQNTTRRSDKPYQIRFMTLIPWNRHKMGGCSTKGHDWRRHLPY